MKQSALPLIAQTVTILRCNRCITCAFAYFPERVFFATLGMGRRQIKR